MKVTITTLRNMIRVFESEHGKREAILERLRNTKVKKCFGLITTTQFDEVYQNDYIGGVVILRSDVIYRNLALKYGYITKDELITLEKTVGLDMTTIKSLKDKLRLCQFNAKVGVAFDDPDVGDDAVLKYIELTEVGEDAI